MEFAKIPVNKIETDKNQPRQNFDKNSLKQLASSIQEVGQLQPVIVRKTAGDNYLLIAGERRYRAVKENDEKEIAAVIIEKEINKKQIQLMENLHRKDLNPLERAKSIQEYIKENNLTKKKAGKKLGIPRTTLTEWLNILEVKPFYQQAVLDEDSSLTLSHISLAKGLAGRTGDPSKLDSLLDGVLKYNFTSRETKEIVNLFNDYLHLSMEEAFDAILIKREQKNYKQKRNKFKDGGQKGNKNSVDNLLKTFDKIGEKLDKFMEKQGKIEDEEKKDQLINEFLYIYQLLEIIIPEFDEYSFEDLMRKIRNKNA